MGVFFANGRQFLVLGASSNPQKFGHRVLRWYLGRKLAVWPINPTSDTILNVKCWPDINSFIAENPVGEAGLGVSIIVPPAVALNALREVVDKGNASHVRSVWFQPGSFDSQVIDYLHTNFVLDELIADGECILVSGISKLREDLEDRNHL